MDEQPSDPDEDEKRRRKSLIALAIVVGLVVVGLYVGHVLRQSATLEDCEMQGRTNCAPIQSDSN